MFLKYPLSGRGKFFICLNWLKITDPPLAINNEQSLSNNLGAVYMEGGRS